MVISYNAYQILGLTSDATEVEIRQRGKELSLKMRVGDVPALDLDRLSGRTIERTDELLQDALHRLGDPRKRIREEALWLSKRVLPVQSIGEVITRCASDGNGGHDELILRILRIRAQLLTQADIARFLELTNTVCSPFGSDYFDDLLDKYANEPRISDADGTQIKTELQTQALDLLKERLVNDLEAGEIESSCIILDGIANAKIDAGLRDDVVISVSSVLNSFLRKYCDDRLTLLDKLNESDTEADLLRDGPKLTSELQQLERLTSQESLPVEIAVKRKLSVCWNNLAFAYANKREDFETALSCMKAAIRVYPEANDEEKLQLSKNKQLFIDYANNAKAKTAHTPNYSPSSNIQTAGGGATDLATQKKNNLILAAIAIGLLLFVLWLVGKVTGHTSQDTVNAVGVSSAPSPAPASAPAIANRESAISNALPQSPSQPIGSGVTDADMIARRAARNALQAEMDQDSSRLSDLAKMRESLHDRMTAEGQTIDSLKFVLRLTSSNDGRYNTIVDRINMYVESFNFHRQQDSIFRERYHEMVMDYNEKVTRYNNMP